MRHNKIIAILSLFFLLSFLFFKVERYKVPGIIMWDVKGYYAYLPPLFSVEPRLERENIVNCGGDCYVNKMSVGLSLLYFPFFILGHIWALIHSGMPANGYSEPYQICLGFSGIFAFMISFLILDHFLGRYFKSTIRYISILTILFGTNLLYYTFAEPMMPHVFNFMLMALFMELTIRWHKQPNCKHSVFLGIICGLISLIRPSNTIFGILFLLYNVASFKDLRLKWIFYVKEYKSIFLLVLSAVLIWLPQMFYWYQKTGSLLFYSYGAESFFFLSPKIGLGLFSFTKGWFVYTPMAFFILLFSIFIPLPKEWRISFLVFIPSFTYLVLSWWNWWYGGSFGHRAFIDILPVLIFLLANLLSKIKMYTQAIFLTLIGFCLLLNLFQTWQYSNYIIHYEGMNYKTYFMVFGKTQKVDHLDEYLTMPDPEMAKKGKVAYWND